MASMTMSTATRAYQHSPLPRVVSPFKDPRPPPPCTPRHTAKIWDEYERRAIDNAKRRDSTTDNSPLQAPQAHRFSSGTVLNVIKNYDPHASPNIPTSSPAASGRATPRAESHSTMPTHHKSHSNSARSTTVAICKTCKQGITSASGICDRCVITIVLPSRPGESVAPLSPARRNFASTDLPKLHRESDSGNSTPNSTSPKRRSRQSSQPTNLLGRLSSLRPESSEQTNSSHGTRKTSLTEEQEPVLRLQINRKPLPKTATAHPSSPTTPPSSAHSRHSRHSSSQPRTTRRTSLANVTTPPQFQYSQVSYSRHTSATPSELSTLYPYVSNSTASPPSVCRASVSLQNTMSAWDDWDSDEEGEKAGLVGYWRAKKWRGSRGSLGLRRDSASGREDSCKEEAVKPKTKAKEKKRSGAFVRVISCGCAEGE